MLEDLQALGVAFVSLAEGNDATTPAGKLQMMHILGAIAEFERERIRERVLDLDPTFAPDRRRSAIAGPGSNKQRLFSEHQTPKSPSDRSE